MNFDDMLMLVGVGPTKTGTGWLYHYLQSHPQFCGSAAKELHYFDALYLDEAGKDRDRKKFQQLQRVVAELAYPPGRKKLKKVEALAHRLAMGTDDETVDDEYLQLFRREVTGATKVFGESSPRYFELPEEGWAAMRATHPAVKLVVQLRDPVDRVHSVMRHRSKKGGRIRFEDWLRRGFLKEAARGSSLRFDLCLERIYGVFPPEDVLVLFYEHLFTNEEVKRLTDFAGLTFETPDFAYVSGRSPPTEAFTDTMRAQVREVLDPVYVYCRARFGERVPATWTP